MVIFGDVSSSPCCGCFLLLLLLLSATAATPQWRTEFRKEMNKAESDANSRAVDSLINYEPVKYFGNEAHELARYDECLAKYQVSGTACTAEPNSCRGYFCLYLTELAGTNT